VHDLTLLTTDTRLKGYRHARVQYFKPLVDRGPLLGVMGCGDRLDVATMTTIMWTHVEHWRS
jgi:hypothetical protein